jgi:hypothetical protein
MLRKLLICSAWFAFPKLWFSQVRNARSTHRSRVGASKGFSRKHTAPPSIACVLTRASGNAVTKMNGTVCPCPRSIVCSWMPPIAGIRTSVMTQERLVNSGDSSSASADWKVHTKYPRDLSRLSTAVRMDASSSTTAITLGVFSRGFSDRFTLRSLTGARGARSVPRYRETDTKVYFGPGPSGRMPS